MSTLANLERQLSTLKEKRASLEDADNGPKADVVIDIDLDIDRLTKVVDACRSVRRETLLSDCGSDDLGALRGAQRLMLHELNELSSDPTDQEAKSRVQVLLRSIETIARVIGARTSFGDAVDVVQMLKRASVDPQLAENLNLVSELVALKARMAA